ncbi:hypothetical protein [Nonomuraea longicatena]|uniref:Uncharacterized protein n=1 Tax=Nonomuraea longicatena TaxID=83682 RepID=A0ABP3ZSD1_9ACTN
MFRRRLVAMGAVSGLILALPLASSALASETSDVNCVTSQGKLFEFTDEATVTIKRVTRSDGTHGITIEVPDSASDDTGADAGDGAAPGLKDVLPTPPANLPSEAPRPEGDGPSLLKERAGTAVQESAAVFAGLSCATE